MNFVLGSVGRILSTGLVGMLLLFPWSCERRPPTTTAPPPPPPPAPNYLALGDRSFEAGDYPSAAEAYRLYLDGNPSAPDGDRVLFRLALVYAIPGSPLYDPPQALALLRELRDTYPQSVLRPQANLLLQWQQETEQLRLEISAREEHIQALVQDMEELRIAEQAEQAEMEKLRSDIAHREERIRQLTEELERLKQIDMQRRPATPRP